MEHKNNSFEALLDRVSQGLAVRTDSRLVQPGEVFVAMPGAKVPGATFIPDALARGAAWIVGDLTSDQVPAEAHGKLIRHPDPAQALGRLAQAYFKTDKLGLKLVGITGTNGKTTIAYLLEHLLSAAGLKVGVMGTVSYRWPGFSLDAKLTTPDCWTLHELLSNMEQSEVDVTVMEVSSHALQQNRPAGLIFDVAVFTNLTQDHLDYHQDMESYFQAKSRLFASCPADDKAWVVNVDDPYGARLAATCPEHALGYGLGPAPAGVDALRGEITGHSVSGLLLGNHYQGSSWEIASPLIGLHNGLNLLAAQAAGLRLGLTSREMKKLSGFAGAPGRLQRVENPQGLNIFVDFAHTPDALENVLSALRELEFKRLIVVFGCGGDRDRAKRPLMGQAVARYADIAVLTSDNPRHEDPEAILDEITPGLVGCPKVIRQVDRHEAIRQALHIATPNDVVVVAGKGHENTQQIGDDYLPFNDVDVIKRILEPPSEDRA